tara:strand:- start:2970 stop:3992 length:1023 start_codon:yes stop_codon:yes gene_type:complete
VIYKNFIVAYCIMSAEQIQEKLSSVLSDSKLKSNKKSRPKVWHKQQELILKKWSEIGSSYRFMHDRSFTKYEKRNLRFALPVIVISTVTGTANFAQGSFPPAWSAYVPLVIGFFNLLAGLITTIAQFLRVSELLEGHRAATIAYSKFSRNISVELSLPKDDRNMDGTEFVNTCRGELDRLIEQSPNIPIDILRRFGKKFALEKFNKPEILEIVAVDIYIDDEKEKLELELMALKKEEEIRRELINTEKIRRRSCIEELTDKNIKTKQNELKSAEEHKKEKKKNMNIQNVETDLNNLIKRLTVSDANNDMITPDSSENEDRVSPTNISNVITDISDVSGNL